MTDHTPIADMEPPIADKDALAAALVGGGSYAHIWAAAITEHRKRVGLSPAELGRMLGVGRQTIYQYELGIVAPSEAKRLVLCRIFGYDPSILFPLPSWREIDTLYPVEAA